MANYRVIDIGNIGEGLEYSGDKLRVSEFQPLIQQELKYCTADNKLYFQGHPVSAIYMDKISNLEDAVESRASDYGQDFDDVMDFVTQDYLGQNEIWGKNIFRDTGEVMEYEGVIYSMWEDEEFGSIGLINLSMFTADVGSGIRDIYSWSYISGSSPAERGCPFSILLYADGDVYNGDTEVVDGAPFSNAEFIYAMWDGMDQDGELDCPWDEGGSGCQAEGSCSDDQG